MSRITHNLQHEGKRKRIPLYQTNQLPILKTLVHLPFYPIRRSSALNELYHKKWGEKKKDFLMVARDLPNSSEGCHQQQLVWLQILGVRAISAPQYIFFKGKETIKFPTPYKIALLFLGFSQNALKSKEKEKGGGAKAKWGLPIPKQYWK